MGNAQVGLPALAMLAILTLPGCFQSEHTASEPDPLRDGFEPETTFDGELMFYGCDHHLARLYEERCEHWMVRIVRHDDGQYQMIPGGPLEELRHSDIPAAGVSLTLVDRVGEPDTYYVLKPRKVDVWLNCEFGPCRYRRTIQGSCCDAAPAPGG